MKEIIDKIKHMLISPSLRSIWHWSEDQRVSLFLLSFGQMAMALLGLLFALATKEIVDAAVSRSEKEIKLYIAVLIVLILLQLLSSFLLRLGNIHVTARMQQKIRSMVIQKVFSKQYSELANIHSGDLTGKIMTDSGTVTNGVIQIIPALLSLATQFLGAAFILLKLDPIFVTSLVILGLIGAACIAVFGRKMKKLHKDTRAKEDRVLGMIQESMQNLRIIKASEIEPQMKERIWNHQQDYVDAQMKRGRFSTATNSVIDMIFRFSWLYAMLWGCFGIYKGSLTYGTLTALLQLVGQIQAPIANFSSLIGQAYGTVSSAERLDELMSLQDEAEDLTMVISWEDMEKMYRNLKEIRVSDLEFSYDRDRVLKGCNLTIHPGDITAITGESGCGKSTFFLLLMGLYQADTGQIIFQIGEEKLSPSRVSRRMFSYVPQGNALFSGSIRENVTMFHKEASEQEIEEAIKMACIDEFIHSLENGLETSLGEKGLGLSEGQAQRIAIARAILSDRPILLLDEATSALDEKTEAKLLENISRMENKTCLIVTHRPAALAICRKHVSLENGMMEVSVTLGSAVCQAS